MGIEALATTTGQIAPSPIDQPRSLTGKITNAEHFSQGFETLQNLGVDALRLAGLVVGDPRPGSKCDGGTLAELMAMPEHKDTAAIVVEAVQEAALEGTDLTRAVFKSVRVALKRDGETGQFVQAPIDPKVLKKNNTR